MMNVQTFNNNMVYTHNKLVNFTEYSSDIIKNVFATIEIFKVLNEKSNDSGFIIPTSLVEKYCNLKITGSSSLKTIGLSNNKDYKKKEGYFLTFNAFQKIIKEHSKEYQECIQQIGEHYGNYCKLFYQKPVEKSSDSDSASDSSSDSDSDSDESSDDSDSDESSDDSDSDVEEEKLIISCPGNIRTYNQQLIDEKKNPSIVEYVKALNDKFYHIDISFIDDFLKLVGINECIIPHMMLEKYGVLTIFDIKTNTEKTRQVARLLEKQLQLPNNLYHMSKVAHQLPSGKKYKNEYLLSPYAFKLCLMRSQKTIKYANYFLLLEDCVKYFNDFHLERNLLYRVSLKKLVKESKKTIKEKGCKIDELKEMVTRIEKSNLEMKKTTEDTNSKLTEMSRDLKFVISKAAEVPKKQTLHNILSIMKEPGMENGYEKYHIVRCQNRNYKKLTQDKEDKYGAEVLFNITSNNGILCWQSMKKYFETNRKFVPDAYSFKYRGNIDSEILKEVLSNSIKNIKNNVSGR